MDLVFEPARALWGAVGVPGDKSVTHRAYLLSSIAEGTTTVHGANAGADCAATRAALSGLGVSFTDTDDGGVRIAGRPAGLMTPSGPLDLGNAGTGMRLLAGLLAGRDVHATLTGDASLRSRPMGRIVDPLRAMGADVTALGEDGRPPLSVRGAAGALRGMRHVLAVASAQVKSCLLLAGLTATGETRVEEPWPSRDHTERMLAAFGAPLERVSQTCCALAGPAPLQSPGSLVVPGDFSAAFFWLVAGSIAPAGELTLAGVGLNPGRTGGLAVLRRMGAGIEVRDERLVAGEPVGDLVVRPATLVATDIEAGEVPALVDELPALAVAQACARGTSRVRGAGELRVKESDRISSVVKALTAIGGTAHESEDGWEITGGTLRGGVVESRGDHRVAMAFGMASLAARGAVRVREAEMIDTSYPRFYSDLRDRVTAR
ncbi:MAG: 3-phosphoshikimate 1-carboxyvinyltransferase [Candidatus Eisenbacteria bacterium]